LIDLDKSSSLLITKYNNEVHCLRICMIETFLDFLFNVMKSLEKLLQAKNEGDASITDYLKVIPTQHKIILPLSNFLKN
jgi:hypothetical protein